jgi:hypothetical protein
MATGQRAVPGETAAVVHDAIVNQAPIPLRDLNAKLPPRLEGIINKALEKNRNLRYQSAAEMRVKPCSPIKSDDKEVLANPALRVTGPVASISRARHVR